jgi:Rieske 2Fe-2S family protein
MSIFVKASVGGGQRTLDRAWYVAPEVFAAERERIFAREWICVGRAESIEKPGDFFVTTVADESLIVVRDSTGALRSFYNVCRHRGTRLCEGSSGHFAGSITCPYHAWTYGLDGALRVARNMSDVPGFDASAYPLKATALAQWEGFVFVNLCADPTPFERAFAPLIGRFMDWEIASLRTARIIDYDLACNWKLVVQNYSECYHCPLVHPQLERLSSSESGRNDLVEGPFLGGFSELRERGASLTTSGATRRAPIGRVGGDDLDRVYYYAIFPSMLLSLHPDYVMVHYLEALAFDRTRVRCAWLFDPAAMMSEPFDPSDAVEFWDLTNRQDWHINELTFAGICSRSYKPGPYAQAEGLLAAFDRHYLSTMEAPHC